MKDNCAIILVRVSTIIQDYEPQVKDLELFAKNLGFKKIKYIETKESGLADLENKVGFNTLKSFIAENPSYNTIFATELSRIGRRLLILLEIKEWLVSNKIQLFIKDSGFSLFDSYGNVSPQADMAFTLYGMFAESEMKQKKERFIRSKKILMEQGLSISGKTLFGYERVRAENNRTTLIPHKEHSEIVQKIFQWYLNGFNASDEFPSIKTIVLNCIKLDYPIYTHSKRNVNKLLKEEGYTGDKTTNNKRKNLNFETNSNEAKYITTQNKIKYPPLISKDVFDAVQKKLLSNNKNADKSNIHVTILSKLISCHACTNHLTGDYRILDGVVKNNYRCSSRSKAIPCQNKQTIGMVMVDSAIWSFIKTDLKALAKSINSINPDLDFKLLNNQKMQLDQQINKNNTEVDELQRAIKATLNVTNINLSDTIGSFQRKINALDKQKGELEKELTRIELGILIQQNKIDDIQAVIENNVETIESSKTMLRDYIRYFIKKIDVLFHDSKFTIFKIIFTNSSIHELQGWDYKAIEEPENKLLRTTYIILDKRRTLNIKAIKSFAPLNLNSDQKICIGSYTFDLEELFDKYINSTKKNEINTIIFKEFKFTKLNVY